MENSPESFLSGRDAQLEKAVEVLKDELEGKKPEVKTASRGD